jgi:hypothetical protein
MTLAYAFVVTCVSTALQCLGPAVQGRVISHASTNLHNLSHGCVGTLLGSAFVVDAGPIYVWLPGLVCLLAMAELTWGSSRLVLAFTVGHIGATLLVAAGLASAVLFGWLSWPSVARATDVGMSYGAAAVLGGLTMAMSRRWRPGWIGWWLAVGVAVVAVGRDFTDVGHAVALVLGMLMSVRLGRPAAWTPFRLALLSVAASFGYLVLASASMVLATASGVAGAALFAAVARWRASSAGGDGAAEEPRIDVGQCV